MDEAIERARASSQTFEIEYRLLRPDGDIRWLISRGRYVSNDDGGVRELIGVAIDITAQVKSRPPTGLATGGDGAHEPGIVNG